MDAGANSSVLPILTVGSLVGFGAVVAAMPAFAVVRDAVLSIQGGPLVSLTVAMNVLAGLTGSASGGMAIALNALGDTFMRLAAEHGIDPALMHRVATISAGTLDALPHNGTVLTVAPGQRTDPPRKLFRHGDDRDRQRDHRTCCRHCTGFGVRVVLIDSRSCMRNGAAPCATAANFPARQVPCEPIMTQRGWISPIEAMAPASRLCPSSDLWGLCPIEIRFFRIPRPSLPIYRDRREGDAGEGSVGPCSRSPASRTNSR